ncbi:MAG TPA: peptidylprolyl isomerase [Ramlibacter sp.]|nr:peptidylprolyl isomerase [Ramlibacter sp.]
MTKHRLTTNRALALGLACAAQALALHLPAHSQGLRITPPAAAPRPTAPPSGPRPADFIVAVVNSEPITNNEVRMRMARFEQQLAQQGQAVPPPDIFARQVLERLISEKAQLQLAREAGVKIEDSTVDQAEQNVARSNQMDVTEFRRQISAGGLSVAAFREDLRNQLMLTRLRERELEPRVRVNDLELDQYIREQQNRTDIGAQEINLAHILVAVPDNSNDAQVTQLRGRAQRIVERARTGEDFAKLARELSDAPGKENGGVIGRRPSERYPPLFVQAVQALPVGGIADLIRTEAGFHIVKLVEKRRAAGLAGGTVEQSHVRHILLRPSPQMSEAAAVQRLADFGRRIKAGQADFAQLAREFSQDASARNGGDLGWANPGLYVPEFEEVVNNLAPGQVSEPLISRFGVHLIQLMERRQATLSQREQRDMARAQLREKKLDEAYLTWAQEVRGRAFVEMREPPQ